MLNIVLFRVIKIKNMFDEWSHINLRINSKAVNYYKIILDSNYFSVLHLRKCSQDPFFTFQNHINTCVQAINLMLPGYLKPLIEDPISEVASDVPDSTSSPVKSPQTCPSPPPSLPFTTAPQRSPEPDLHCEEDLSNDCQLTEEFSNDECCLSPGDEKHRDSRTSSPLSAVDIFNEFDDSDVLQVMFEQNDSPFSILVSWDADIFLLFLSRKTNIFWQFWFVVPTYTYSHELHQ